MSATDHLPTFDSLPVLEYEEIDSFQFFTSAEEYLRAAEVLNRNSGVTKPAYFLICQSIELGLKAYLKLQGNSTKWLKDNIGHDLQKGLQLASSAGLKEVSEEFEFMVAELSDLFNAKQFQYFSRSSMAMPGLKDCCEQTRIFLDTFKGDCYRQLGNALRNFDAYATEHRSNARPIRGQKNAKDIAKNLRKI